MKSGTGRAAALRARTRMCAIGAFIALAAGASAQVQQQRTVVGSVPGGWSVSPSGAAIYRIPIDVPPGVAGMEPRLELVYSSQSGNGPLGVGWSIGGLSAITRCPLTLAHDGIRGAVRMDATDRYCLDGQRLLLAGGAWGGNGSYATEIESHARIESIGGHSSGPTEFKVQTKAGLTMRYGSASGRTAAGGVLPAWLVDDIRDAKGNEIAIEYVGNSGTGEFLPQRVRYGGNARLGQPHTLQVVFVWDARPDRERAWRAGVPQGADQRLARVQVMHQDMLLRDYRLRYETSTASGRSRLVAVELCEAASCLGSRTFGWTDTVLVPSAMRVNADPARGAQQRAGWSALAGDFDGDGRTDLLWDEKMAPAEGSNRSAGRRVVWKTTPFSTQFTELANPSSTDGSLAGYEPHLGDFDGDGKTDIFWDSKPSAREGATLSSGNHRLWISTGNGFANQPIQYKIFERTGYQPTIADFDGDGRADIFWDAKKDLAGGSNRSRGIHSIWFTQPELSFRRVDVGTIGELDGFQPYIGDFDGDGRADILWDGKLGIQQGSNRSDGRRVLWLGRGDGTFTVIRNVAGADGWCVGCEPVIVDLNGDGIADVFWDEKLPLEQGPSRSAGRRSLWIGRGDGSFERQANAWSQDGALVGHEAVFGDFNGDGRVDILWDEKVNGPVPGRSAGRRTLWLSKAGDRIDVVPNAFGHDGQFVGSVPLVGDWFGRGRSEILWDSRLDDPDGAGRSGGRRWLVQAAGDSADLMTHSTDGHGLREGVSYLPLTTGAYARDADAVYPHVDVQLPLFVVASVYGGAPGSESLTGYAWRGLKAEVGTGRGLLGFRVMTTVNEQTGIETTTEFRQDVPYVGLARTVTVRLPGSGKQGLLKRTSHTYARIAGSVPGSVFPYVARSVEESWDLSGTPLPAVRTESVFGQQPPQGDPTRVTVTTDAGLGAHVRTTEHEYAPPQTGAGKWILGRVTRTVVTTTAPPALATP